jgi:hypothetical protein
MEQAKSNKIIFIIPVLVAVVSMTLLFICLIHGWFGTAKWGSGAGEFCEAFRPGLIKQPANTWSNLGFIIAGLAMAWLLMKGTFSHNNNSITQNLIYGAFYSSIIVFLGPGSMAMHASGGHLGGFFDMLSMYLVASFTVAYAAERFFRLSPVYFVGIFVMLLTFCIWADGQPYHIIMDFFGTTVFMFLIITTIVLEALNSFIRKMQHDKRWAIASALALGAAFAVWNVSLTGGCLCDPHSLIQGHAIWHILDAIAAFCLFMFYASEHTGDTVQQKVF